MTLAALNILEFKLLVNRVIWTKAEEWTAGLNLGWYRNGLSTELRSWPKDEEWTLIELGLVSQWSVNRVIFMAKG